MTDAPPTPSPDSTTPDDASNGIETPATETEAGSAQSADAPEPTASEQTTSEQTASEQTASEQPASEQPASEQRKKGRGDRKARGQRAQADPTRELMTLLEFAAKYPEIGPSVASLAFKLGKSEIGERLVRMGQQGDTPNLEYYFVTAHTARREQRWTDVLDIATEALGSFIAARDKEAETDESASHDDSTRLLHLLRLGFSTLMFEFEDVKASPGFVEALGSGLPQLESLLGEDPFFRTLVAQTLWFEDRERSEQEWDRAAEMSDSDFAWNARGTWYKEAERDLEKAEKAYRKGLEAMPRSALLLHNVAQVLLDRVEKSKDDPRAANRLLNEAEDLLRSALRESASKNRRHVHATRDRVSELRREFPRPRKPRRDGSQNRGPRRRGPDDGSRSGGGERRGQRRESRGESRDDSRDDSREGGGDDARNDQKGDSGRDDRGPRGDSGGGRGRDRRPRRRDGDDRGDRRREGGGPPRGRGRGGRRVPRDDRGERGGSRDSRANDKGEAPAKFNLGDMLAAKFKEQEKKD